MSGTKLYDFAKLINIFSTPFDESAVDLLDKLQTPAFKITSFEITDLHLISYMASKSKPILFQQVCQVLVIADAIEACLKKIIKKFYCSNNINTLLN